MNENLKFLKEVFESESLPEESLPEFVFWGRSNVGKSSLINSITKSKIAKTSKTPGRTRSLVFFEFEKKCREIGITVPIIPGLKPITNLRHLTFIPKFFNTNFPEEFSNELEKCKTNDEVKKVGIEWSTIQSKELVKAGVPVLHFYTMGRGESVKNIASKIF